MYYQYDTDTDNINEYGAINEIQSAIRSGDWNLLISFAFKFSFFLEAAIWRWCWGRALWRGVQWICRGDACAGMRSQQNCKVASMRSHFGVGVLLSACCTFLECCFLRAPLEAGLLLLFFCFGINPRGEIGIQLDIGLWSLERWPSNLIFFAESSVLVYRETG